MECKLSSRPTVLCKINRKVRLVKTWPVSGQRLFFAIVIKVLYVLLLINDNERKHKMQNHEAFFKKN